MRKPRKARFGGTNGALCCPLTSQDFRSTAGRRPLHALTVPADRSQAALRRGQRLPRRARLAWRDIVLPEGPRREPAPRGGAREYRLLLRAAGAAGRGGDGLPGGTRALPPVIPDRLQPRQRSAKGAPICRGRAGLREGPRHRPGKRALPQQSGNGPPGPGAHRQGAGLLRARDSREARLRGGPQQSGHGAPCAERRGRRPAFLSARSPNRSDPREGARKRGAGPARVRRHDRRLAGLRGKTRPPRAPRQDPEALARRLLPGGKVHPAHLGAGFRGHPSVRAIRPDAGAQGHHRAPRGPASPEGASREPPRRRVGHRLGMRASRGRCNLPAHERAPCPRPGCR